MTLRLSGDPPKRAPNYRHRPERAESPEVERKMESVTLTLSEVMTTPEEALSP